MTHPGFDAPAPGQQPAAPGAWTPPQEGPAPEKKSGAKKWASLVGTLVVVGVGGAYTLTGGFGMNDPKVGDCIKSTGETSFDVVDCDSDEAENKIVGIDDKKVTMKVWQESDELCADFADKTEYVLWVGDVETEPGTVYCAGTV